MHGAGIANPAGRPETWRMRMLYLTLGLFMLLGIGATCRTPSLVAVDDAAGLRAEANPRLPGYDGD